MLSNSKATKFKAREIKIEDQANPRGSKRPQFSGNKSPLINYHTKSDNFIVKNQEIIQKYGIFLQ